MNAAVWAKEEVGQLLQSDWSGTISNVTVIEFREIGSCVTASLITGVGAANLATTWIRQTRLNLETWKT